MRCASPTCPRPADALDDGTARNAAHTFSGYGYHVAYHPECCPGAVESTCPHEHPAGWQPETLAPEEPHVGAVVQRRIDGLEMVLYPMTFGKVRLNLGLEGALCFDKGWCYEDPEAGIAAAVAWDGEGDPLGPWHRAVHDGRRREWRDGELVREWSAW